VLFRKPGLIDDGAGSKKRAAGRCTTSATAFYKGGLQTMGRGVSTEPERWITTSLGERYKEFGVLDRYARCRHGQGRLLRSINAIRSAVGDPVHPR
jgi:hypothetical protein